MSLDVTQIVPGTRYEARFWPDLVAILIPIQLMGLIIPELRTIRDVLDYIQVVSKASWMIGACSHVLLSVATTTELSACV